MSIKRMKEFFPQSPIFLLAFAIVTDTIVIYSGFESVFPLQSKIITCGITFIVALLINLSTSILTEAFINFFVRKQNRSFCIIIFIVAPLVFIIGFGASLLARFAIPNDSFGAATNILEGVTINTVSLDDSTKTFANVILAVYPLGTNLLVSLYKLFLSSPEREQEKLNQEIKSKRQEKQNLERQKKKLEEFSPEQERDYLKSVIEYQMMQTYHSINELKIYAREQLKSKEGALDLLFLEDTIAPPQYLIDNIDLLSNNNQKAISNASIRSDTYKKMLFGEATTTLLLEDKHEEGQNEKTT